MAGITIPTKSTGNQLSAAEFNQLLDTLKDGLRSISTSGLESLGYITGKKSGVYAYLTETSVTNVVTPETYYPIAGTFSNSIVEDFGAATVVTPGIKYTGTLATEFEIDWHSTVQAVSNNSIVHCAIKKNGVLLPGSVMGTLCKTGGDPYTISGTCVVELSTDDEIQLVLTSSIAGNISVIHFTTTIARFFL